MKQTRTTAKERERFADEMAESFGDLHALGLIDEATYKRTLRDLDREAADNLIRPMSGDEIRALREQANVSQGYLARHLNLSRDHLSKIERGAIPPTGALLAMLNLIRRKGIEVIL
jgi:putative transcriptional regulator